MVKHSNPIDAFIDAVDILLEARFEDSEVSDLEVKEAMKTFKLAFDYMVNCAVPSANSNLELSNETK